MECTAKICRYIWKERKEKPKKCPKCQRWIIYKPAKEVKND